MWKELQKAWADIWQIDRLGDWYIGAIVAVVIAIFEKIFHPSRWLYKSYLEKPIQKLRRILRKRGEETLHEAVVLNSISSNYADKVPPRFIANAISKHGAITINKRFHYRDPSKIYHARRRFKLFPILNGDETFFSEICKVMSEQIDFNEINLTLFIKKEANKLFAQKFAGNYPSRIRAHELLYKEKRKWFMSDFHPEFDYEAGESLEGTNVILLESLLVFPEPLFQTIRWIRDKGANIKKVIILFDATHSLSDFDDCGINLQDVIIGIPIDLEVELSAACKCSGKSNTTILKYDDY